MNVAFKCRRKDTPALPPADLQPELEQRESQLPGMDRHLLFCLSNSFT